MQLINFHQLRVEYSIIEENNVQADKAGEGRSSLVPCGRAQEQSVKNCYTNDFIFSVELYETEKYGIICL
ncbi:SYCP2; synaptonemal complex protein 2 [Ktedonobacter racemifer DSM 44963]|uniref:SYCP2 synaptonemal complex protein 2 n=1 Tax=Ktedonobacter racemifer DSM 44963 TaxID=485913 RepID=D6TM61_KTERA|nr:SYCP2; synaptonemal complex protein 2 [Ktedonobacter racemifer DSM 44963]